MATAKQIRAINKIKSENMPVSKAMLAVGYKPSTARRAQLTKTKAFQEVFNSAIPDDMLAKKHKQLLNKNEIIVKISPETGEMIVTDTGHPDAQAVKAALDMAYKIKGSYAPEKHLNANIELNEEVKNKAKKAIRALLEQ